MNKFINYLKNNAVPIIILLAIIFYMFSRYSFSTGTVEYRIDSHNERVELENHLDDIDKKLDDIEKKIDKINGKLEEMEDN